MSVSRTISLPDEILDKAKEFAAREHISLDELVSAALSEKFAGAEYLRQRGERASAERFRAAWDRIPDNEPEPWDRVP
jgi:hypothetical protein